MARHRLARPTDSELEILKVLWEQGPSTVRDIHDALAASRKTGYTTILKQLQIMAEKGIVARDEDQRAHVYAAKTPREQTERELVGDLLDRAFDGSTSKLVLHALESKRASREEIDEIRRLLESYEGGKR
jgi:predicted transcriptional regulator